MSKTIKYQLTDKTLQLQNFRKLYTNTTITNFTRPVFNVFDKGKDCIAALIKVKPVKPVSLYETIKLFA